MAKHPRLVKRGNLYEHRVRVPKDLVEKLGKKQIWKSLGTGSYREAVRRARARDVEIDRLFATARGEAVTKKDRLPSGYLGDTMPAHRPTVHPFMRSEWRAEIENLPPPPRPLADLTKEDAKGIAEAYLSHRLSSAAKVRRHEGKLEPFILQEFISNCEESLGLARHALAENNFEEVAGTAELLLTVNRRRAEPKSEEWALLCEYLLRADVECADRNLAWLKGEHGRSAFDELFEEVDDRGGLGERTSRLEAYAQKLDGSPKAKVPSARRSLTLGELIARFDNHPNRESEGPTAARNRKVGFQLLREELGDDHPISEIKREHFTALQGLLVRLPKNAGKHYPNMLLRAAVERGEEEGRPRIETKTVNNHLTAITTLFSFAEQEGLVGHNYARRLHVKARYTPGARRRPFSIEELNTLFSAPVYTGCEDDERNWKNPGDQHPRRARFWAAPISLFTGMRMGEILQLEDQDIQERQGVWGIEVTSAKQDTSIQKSIKSAAAHRFIPIHDELIRLGFLEFAAQRRTEPSTRLFPECMPCTAGGYTDPFQKWFTRLLKKNGGSHLRHNVPLLPTHMARCAPQCPDIGGKRPATRRMEWIRIPIRTLWIGHQS